MRRVLLLSLATALASIAPAMAGTLEDIKARGVVNCAVEDKAPGFSELDGSTRVGLAVDLCVLLAAAVLGKPNAVAFVVVTEADSFAALQAGEADVLLAPLPWTFAHEVEQGILNVQPMLHHAGEGEVFGPVVRQGDDSWFVAVRWVLFTLMRGAKQDLTEGHVQAGRTLGLDANWSTSIEKVVSNYAALLEPHNNALTTAGWRNLALDPVFSQE